MIHTAFALEFLLAPVGHLKRFRDNKFFAGGNFFANRRKENNLKQPTEDLFLAQFSNENSRESSQHF
jgi:hypothetical protein